MMKNDDGIAYGLIAVAVFIAGVALIYLTFTPMMNAAIGEANALIGEGHIGAQTAGAMGWSLGWFGAIPIIALLGIFVWAYVRALEEDRQ